MTPTFSSANKAVARALQFLHEEYDEAFSDRSRSVALGKSPAAHYTTEKFQVF